MIIFLLLILIGIYNAISEPTPSKVFLEKVSQQQNPFSVPKDSADIVWQRAQRFLETRKRWIGGGNIHQSDSLILIPYSNSFYRGTSLRIEKSIHGDSVVFKVIWHYSNKLSNKLSNELALYMRTGIDRYHYK